MSVAIKRDSARRSYRSIAALAGGGCAHAGADGIPVPDRGIRGATQGPGVCRRVIGAPWGDVEALKGRAGANPVQELLAVPPRQRSVPFLGVEFSD